MNGLLNTGVSVGFTLDDVVRYFIDDVTLGAVVGFTLGDAVGVISGVGEFVGFTFSDEAEIKFYETMMVEPWWMVAVVD